MSRNHTMIHLETPFTTRRAGASFDALPESAIFFSGRALVRSRLLIGAGATAAPSK
jgi:hypothetical protein